MKCDITINDKSFDCVLEFALSDFQNDKNYKDALAIVTMVAGDYNLDPEIELNEFRELINNGKSEKKLIKFFIDEDEIEAEFFV